MHLYGDTDHSNKKCVHRIFILYTINVGRSLGVSKYFSVVCNVFVVQLNCCQMAWLQYNSLYPLYNSASLYFNCFDLMHQLHACFASSRGISWCFICTVFVHHRYALIFSYNNIGSYGHHIIHNIPLSSFIAYTYNKIMSPSCHYFSFNAHTSLSYCTLVLMTFSSTLYVFLTFTLIET